jgi:hypothetical protein
LLEDETRLIHIGVLFQLRRKELLQHVQLRNSGYSLLMKE